MWEDAFTDDFSSIQTVEIPLELKKFSIPIHPECKAKYNETKDPKYLNAITRLIIKTDSKTGRTDGFFMYIIPSLKYLEKTNFRPLNNSYLSKDEKYDGYIIFRDLSGNYVNGWMYEEGKIKKSLKPATNELPLTKAVEPTVECLSYYMIYYTFFIDSLTYVIDNVVLLYRDCWITNDYVDPIDGDPGGSPGSYIPPEFNTLTLAIDGGGIITGSGSGTYNSQTTVTLDAVPHSDCVFGGWSGDIRSRNKTLLFLMNKNYSLKATFYLKTSDCGKLIVAVANIDSLLANRKKINGPFEHGYTKNSSGEYFQGIIGNGKLGFSIINNITEVVHTHELEMHPSEADLAKLFARYSRGQIADVNNFTYTIVTPEYFVVFQIDNPSQMDNLINDNFLSTDSSGNAILGKKYYDMYHENIPLTPNSVSGYFQNFIDFANQANLGLKISLHKTDSNTGEETAKFITSRGDVDDLLNKIESCIK